MGSLPVTISLHPLPYPTSPHPTPPHHSSYHGNFVLCCCTAASQPGKLTTPTATDSLHLIFTTRCSETASKMTPSSTIAAKTSHNFSLLTNLWLLSNLFYFNYNSTSLLWVCTDWAGHITDINIVLRLASCELRDLCSAPCDLTIPPLLCTENKFSCLNLTPLP